MNPVIEFLQKRQSTPAGKLSVPAPDTATLEHCFAAAQSAPDHGGLTPWRFEVITGSALYQLADVLEAALLARKPDASPASVQRERERALRAPMVVLAIACLDPKQAKVPILEQQLAAGCATLQFMQAVHSCGYGAVWLSGDRIYQPTLLSRLRLGVDEQLIGLINIGTAPNTAAQKQRVAARVRYWHGR